MRKINKIILHCSTTPEGRDYSVDTIRDWHVNDNGWSDIGYHYVIQLDGTINEGRPIEISGAHTRGQNRNSIGICYIGGVESQKDSQEKWITKDTRTYEQKDSLDKFLKSLMEEYPNATLHGHNEFASKDCPSFDVQVEYDYLINDNIEQDNYKCDINTRK